VSATAKAVDKDSVFAEVNDKIDKILGLTKGPPQVRAQGGVRPTN
jgi:hypothetical protein